MDIDDIRALRNGGDIVLRRRTPAERLRYHAKIMWGLGTSEHARYLKATVAASVMESVADDIEGKGGVWLDDHRDAIVATLLRVQHLFEQGVVEFAEQPDSWTRKISDDVDDLLAELTA